MKKASEASRKFFSEKKSNFTPNLHHSSIFSPLIYFYISEKWRGKAPLAPPVPTAMFIYEIEILVIPLKKSPIYSKPRLLQNTCIHDVFFVLAEYVEVKKKNRKNILAKQESSSHIQLAVMM